MSNLAALQDPPNTGRLAPKTNESLLPACYKLIVWLHWVHRIHFVSLDNSLNTYFQHFISCLSIEASELLSAQAWQCLSRMVYAAVVYMEHSKTHISGQHTHRSVNQSAKFKHSREAAKKPFVHACYSWQNWGFLLQWKWSVRCLRWPPADILIPAYRAMG